MSWNINYDPLDSNRDEPAIIGEQIMEVRLIIPKYIFSNGLQSPIKNIT